MLSLKLPSQTNSQASIQTKQKPCLGSDGVLSHRWILDWKYCQINWL
jgi:hypothetical protein